MDSGCGRSKRDVLGAIGKSQGSNEETWAARQEGVENATEERNSAVAMPERRRGLGDEIESR